MWLISITYQNICLAIFLLSWFANGMYAFLCWSQGPWLSIVNCFQNPLLVAPLWDQNPSLHLFTQKGANTPHPYILLTYTYTHNTKYVCVRSMQYSCTKIHTLCYVCVIFTCISVGAPTNGRQLHKEWIVRCLCCLCCARSCPSRCLNFGGQDFGVPYRGM